MRNIFIIQNLFSSIVLLHPNSPIFKHLRYYFYSLSRDPIDIEEAEERPLEMPLTLAFALELAMAFVVLFSGAL